MWLYILVDKKTVYEYTDISLEGLPEKSSKRNSEWKIYRNIRKLIWFSGKLFQLNLKLTERTKDNG